MTAPNLSESPAVIGAVLTQHVEVAAQLRRTRSIVVRAPQAKLRQLGDLDERLAAHLDGIAVAGGAGRRLVIQSLEQCGKGEVFVAAIGAIEDRDADRFERLLAIAEALPSTRAGLSSALGWVSASALRGLAASLLAPEASPWRRQAGLAACAMHGVDPGPPLAASLRDADAALRATALRIAGACAHVGLLGACLAALDDADPRCRFEAAMRNELAGSLGRNEGSPDVGRDRRSIAPPVGAPPSRRRGTHGWQDPEVLAFLTSNIASHCGRQCAMRGPITRTFLRTKDGTRHFVEISWQGSDVEVVTGKVETAGRGSPKVFENITERDAFIAKRIDRALREGFVEGVPADVPAPEPPDPEERRVVVLLKKHKATAYLPRVDVDDARQASKFGGTPWLDGADTWPACTGCSQPLRFVCQLALADVPEPVRWAFRSDLLQLFLCDSTGKAGDPEWLCQAQGEGWEAFARSTVVRHVSCASGPSDIRETLPLSLLDLRRRRWLESMASYCRRGGDEEDAKTWEARISTEKVDPKSYDVPASVEQFRLDGSFLLPAKRVAAWSGEPDVPAYGDLDLDEVDALQERGLRCQSADKLGGYPCWAQSPKVPRCPGCRTEMRYLMQLVTNGTVPIGIGGDGLGWIFVCPMCREATFTWQR